MGTSSMVCRLGSIFAPVALHLSNTWIYTPQVSTGRWWSLVLPFLSVLGEPSHLLDSPSSCRLLPSRSFFDGFLSKSLLLTSPRTCPSSRVTSQMPCLDAGHYTLPFPSRAGSSVSALSPLPDPIPTSSQSWILRCSKAPSRLPWLASFQGSQQNCMVGTLVVTGTHAPLSVPQRNPVSASIWIFPDGPFAQPPCGPVSSHSFLLLALRFPVPLPTSCCHTLPPHQCSCLISSSLSLSE